MMIVDRKTNLFTKSQQLNNYQNRLLKIQHQLEQEHFIQNQADNSAINSHTLIEKLKLLTPKRVLKICYWLITLQFKQRLQRRKTALLIIESGLFQTGYYWQQNPEVEKAGIDPLGHYLDYGAAQGRKPNPLFDTAYYLQQNPEVAQSGVNPLAHYYQNGAREGRKPNPLFDTSYYLEQNPDVAESGLNPLVHYLQEGGYQGRKPNPLFNSGYYLQQNPEVAQSGVNPLVHYLECGAQEGRKPNPLFDSGYYLQQNPEVAHSGLNPLAHYLECGAREGRKPNSLFDSAYYLAQNPEVAQSGLNPLAHYLECGAREGRKPNPFFDGDYYLEQNPDVAEWGDNPLAHYIDYGAYQGRLAWSLPNVMRIIQEESSVLSQTQKLINQTPNRALIFSSYRSHPKVGIYCSSIGNYFMAEMADLLAAAFEKIGLEAIRLSEFDVFRKELDYEILMAPQEFFYLGEGQALARHKSWLSKLAIINVDQPHSTFFSKSFHFLRQARLILDINFKSAEFLDRLGFPAYFLPLGYLRNYAPFEFCQTKPDLLILKSISEKHWNQVSTIHDFKNRPIDIFFIGTLSEKRELFFANSAKWLSQYRCFLHIPPLDGTFIQGQGNALTTEAAMGLSQRSKILLNIHRDELPYFEWHRLVLQGLWQKTLVLTEPSNPIPGIVPGEHYLECEAKAMPEMIEWLLKTEEGQALAQKVRLAGYNVLADLFNLEKIALNIIQILKEKTKN
ncbi:hypothetical protein [Gloeothece verrucosa]|uniref:Uncharacterized protein n=1 Tax=Gloeothece verrucosa (strain PCC 7822) TaxID=497965 RepID=E0U9T1_GLOV7|nr:hypothetical protein [Gloeothece verrucosa]ADN15001.1 hypothetical protein Cyan7822_3046 [Gloeothece verrucosa PCC 7822]